MMIIITIIASLLTFTTSQSNNYVIQLNDSNFEHLTQASSTKDQTTKGKKWFINFHSTTCGHCLNLAPIWSTLSEEIKDFYLDSDFIIGSVDVNNNPILSKRFGITQLPTILLFAEGGMFEYPPSRPRNVDEFIKFLIGSTSSKSDNNYNYNSDNNNNDTSNGDDQIEAKHYYKQMTKLQIPKSQEGIMEFVADLRKMVYDIEFLRFLLDDVEHILVLRKNAAVLLIGIGIVFGFLFASVIGLSRSTTSSNKVMATKQKKE